MNYEQIRSMASAGINFFSDGTGEFDCITQPGSVEIVGCLKTPTTCWIN